LSDALDRGPQTLVHSDWKAGNLGSHADGRTVLLDWAFPGAAPWSVDLAWYLAVNCDLIAQSKEDAIAAYRESLMRRGVDVADRWDEQLECGLLLALVHLGWSKTGAELEWWADRVQRAVRYLA
jgi:aminoglycoside phosphotransferase (APT) family kinase protein